MTAAECPTAYGGDLWDGVPRVSLAANHRDARQACADCVNLCALPGIHVFAATQDVDGRDKPGHDDFNLTGKCSNRRNASAETALAAGPALQTGGERVHA